MKKKLLLTLAAAVFLLSFAITGCQDGGIAQEAYDQVLAQFNESQEKINEARDNISTMEAERDAFMAELDEAKSKAGELEGLVNSLKEQYELVGATPAETAAKVVEYYHDTHVYDKWDLFVCTDMASEVWNMLKAHGINALMVVGSVDSPISDIILSDHAWVLAELAPGDYLALETTGGRVVYPKENPLYYHGWYFTTPADQKTYQNLVREYNTRVNIRNEIASEVNAAAAYYNQSVDQAQADQRLPVYEKLLEIQESMEAELNDIQSEIGSLAVRL